MMAEALILSCALFRPFALVVTSKKHSTWIEIVTRRGRREFDPRGTFILPDQCLDLMPQRTGGKK
jgi:hypothetical protein